MSTPHEICSGDCCGLPTHDNPDELIAVLKALSNPVRFRIVAYVANAGEPTCICGMVDTFNVSQPTLSHHLKKLVDAEILVREMRGTSAYYSLLPDVLAALGEVIGTWALRTDAEQKTSLSITAK